MDLRIHTLWSCLSVSLKRSCLIRQWLLEKARGRARTGTSGDWARATDGEEVQGKAASSLLPRMLCCEPEVCSEFRQSVSCPPSRSRLRSVLWRVEGRRLCRQLRQRRQPQWGQLRRRSLPAPKRRRRPAIKMQDVGELKAKKEKLRKELKTLSERVKLEDQKKTRLLRKAPGLQADDLQWTLDRRRAEEGVQAATSG